MDIVALQESRWPLAGKVNTKDYVIYYSGCDNNRYYGGTGFAVRKRWSEAVLSFNPINERMCTLRIKGKFTNMSLVSIYAPTEDADEEDKDSFYEHLEDVTNELPQYDLRLILGDANAKVGKEEIWTATAGKESLHQITNDNGIRLLSFSESLNFKIMSTHFPHKEIHKETWVSPNGNVRNQIDHVLIDRRHKTSILDVHSLRGAECGSDHNLVLVKVFQRIAIKKEKRTQPAEIYEIENLKEKKVVEDFRLKLKNRFQELANLVDETETPIEERWNIIKESIQEVTKETCGRRRKKRKKIWFDDECARKIEERKISRIKWLEEQSDEAKQRYRLIQNETNKLLRKKKRQHINKILTKTEEDVKNPKIFYNTVKLFKQGFKPSSFGVKQDGKIIIEKSKVLEVWRKYFENLLNVEEESLDDTTPEIFINVQPEVEEPSLEEVEKAIREIKNNKAPGNDGINIEIIKAGGKEIAIQIHKLLTQIWRKEEMPKDWEEAIIVPLHKKGDKQEPSNYRGISLLNTTYKIFSKILLKRLEIYTNEIIEDRQAGFMKNRSTTDQIFILRQAISKYWEFNKQFYGLFIDFSKAYDSLCRKKIWEKMESYGIPNKLIRLIELSVKNSKCKVKVENEYSATFEVKTGVRQGDGLSPILFNIALEEALKEVNKTNLGIKIIKNISVLAFADDVVILAENKRDLEDMTKTLILETKTVGLKINDDKTKFMYFGRNQDNSRYFTVENHNFEKVNEFKYLGTIISSNNSEQSEIQNRIISANRSLFAVNKLMSSKILSTHTKIRIYKTVIRPILLYGAESWTMDKATERKLITFENKILRKVFGPTNENGIWRIKHNKEIRDLFGAPDIVAEARSRRLRWAGHIFRRDDNSILKQVWEGNPEGRRPRGRPKKRWKDEVIADMNKLRVTEEDAEDRMEWRRIVGEAKYHLGYKWPWE